MTDKSNCRNPYIIGRSIYEPEKFFGREDLFPFIKDNLNSNTKILLLHGQRRIGKSSLLKQFDHQIGREEFVFICFDLQQHSQSSLSEVLYNLAEEIVENLGNLELDSDITLPSQEEFNSNSNIFSDEFLPQVYHKLGERNLVLLLDEFDVINSEDNILNHGHNFFQYLNLLLIRQTKLFIIPVLGRSRDDFQNLYQLFNRPPSQEIGLLNEVSARRLITRPVHGTLEYEEDAIKLIFKLSSGHPYFTQAICFNIFLQAKIADKWKVTCEDVDQIVDQAIKNVEAGLAWFWDGLSIPQKVVFSAVADAQKTAEQKQSFPEDPFTRLKTYGVIQTEELIQAAKQLVEKGYLDDTEHRVKVELVRRWLAQSHPLNQEIFQLDEIKKEEINKILERAKHLYRQARIQDEIDHYEEILKLNPNHFSTIPILAESYLQIKNFDKALTLYTQAYQANPIRNKEGLLLAREAYGKDLRKQRELIKAKVQFEGVLEIEPDRELAKQQLLEIDAELDKQEAPQIEQQEPSQIGQQKTPPIKIENQLINWIRQPATWRRIALVIVILSGTIGIRFYQKITSCSEEQQQVNGSCVSINPTPVPTSNSKTPATQNPTSKPTQNVNIDKYISRGDRTLFVTIPNTYRDEGIKAFKESNYSLAVESFQQAVTTNRSDPEVRIYYNNAKARKKGNPLTLAVVVPVDNGKDRALEILRGVAQSQDQFNFNSGFNGRLLEIVIANDADNPEQAQQIAQQLVKNQSVLAVIGHGSSRTTQAALDNIYKQANIPIISPTSTASTLEGKNFFRTTPSDAAFGEKLGKYAVNNSLNKVVIVYNSKNNYSISLMTQFVTHFKGEIISLIDLTRTPNIEQELKNTTDKQAQAVMLFPDVEHIATALEVAQVNVNNKLNLKLLGGDSLYNIKTLNDGKNVFQGLILAVPWFRETQQAKNFSRDAKQLWGGDISWRTATSYDATQAFINSVSSPPSRPTILQGLKQLNLSAKATSGNDLKFQNGERQSKAILVTVDRGQFRCLEKCSP